MSNKIKIFLTGGSGMVGKNILENKNSKKYEIISPNRKELDLLNYNKVSKFLKINKPDIIVHAAGHVGGIQANMKNPYEFLSKNLDISKNIIVAAYENEVKKFLNLGSTCMYPKDTKGYLSEDQILKGKLEPTNEGYALAKIVSYKLCNYINEINSQYTYKTMIPCNLYGKYDKFSEKNSHLIPAIINKMHIAKINKINEVEMWGDGLARREFMYAGDLADAIFYGLKRFYNIPNVLNIGLGYDYKIIDYYKQVAKVVNWKGKIIKNLDKPIGMKKKCANIKLQKKWGWVAKTNLVAGIKLTYKYYLSQNKNN